VAHLTLGVIRGCREADRCQRQLVTELSQSGPVPQSGLWHASASGPATA
jgi:hypothetical protein